jgi:hypothetical protein
MQANILYLVIVTVSNCKTALTGGGGATIGTGGACMGGGAIGGLKAGGG